ncbi:MAG: protein-glutamate O-methyltransferase CheR [Deltaproteobacteria bacterium]|nr:protein-glutamate O-methyltransferase CheR [Deltaproteobacteria bacterium]MBN2672822.1 protein-glutamate O-methyltransferase CheR [Deltaproteobacteria bacterium]
MMQMSSSNISFPLSITTFRIIRDLVNRRFGIFFQDSDRYLLESRLSSRIHELHLSDFEQYTECLCDPDHSKELDGAIEVLTNNETYFFREDYQLNAFAEELLPRIRLQNESRRQITIWSAGCSSGEEAYTIAMVINESRQFSGWDIRIFGSDVSSRMLTRARNGIFSKSAFRNTSDQLRDKYFTRSGNQWQVKPLIRNKCNFSKINLLDREKAAILGKFDAIFCRNVLMYFDKKSRAGTIGMFHERLHPQGYLLLGHTESLFNQRTSFVQVNLRDALVYQKEETHFD